MAHFVAYGGGGGGLHLMFFGNISGTLLRGGLKNFLGVHPRSADMGTKNKKISSTHLRVLPPERCQNNHFYL